MDTDYAYSVIKLFRKMKDGDVFAPKADHPNFSKFIEACKELVSQRVTEKFKNAFTITFNNSFTKIKRNDFPRASIWEPYFKESYQAKRIHAEYCKNAFPYNFVPYEDWKWRIKLGK